MICQKIKTFMKQRDVESSEKSYLKFEVVKVEL